MNRKCFIKMYDNLLFLGVARNKKKIDVQGNGASAKVCSVVLGLFGLKRPIRAENGGLFFSGTFITTSTKRLAAK